MLHDLKQALRGIGRAKGTTVVLLLSLGLGTGANASVYGALETLLFRGPSGVGDPGRMVEVFTTELSGEPYGLSSYPDFQSLKESAKALAAVAALQERGIENVSLERHGRSTRVVAVSDEFFDVLQMQAHAGELLALPSDGDEPPAVISFELAESAGAPEQAVGRRLTIGDRTHVVVGVAPEAFRGLRAGREADVWIPLASTSGRGDRRLAIVARLARSATADAAAEELARISSTLASRYPESNRGTIVSVDAARRFSLRRYSPLDPGARAQAFFIAVVVGGAAALLLASACFNVGNLLLSSAVARRQEIAIKLSLGATRGRLVRQLLAETFVLCALGGALGLLFAVWTGQSIPALFVGEQAGLLDTRLSARLLLMTVGVAVISGAVFGIAPALHGTSTQPSMALRADAGGISQQHGGRRLRAWLVGGQLALSTVLLVGTGQLVSSLAHVLEGDRADAVRRVAVVSMELPGRFVDTVAGIQYRNRMLQQVAEMPGIEASGWTSTLPLERGNRRPFSIEGKNAAVSDRLEFETNVVSAGYFPALALECVEGRLFTAADHGRAPAVAVIDELLARRYFGAHAIGRHLIDAQGAPIEIVGVVKSGTYRTLQQTPQPTVFFHSGQDYLFRGHLVVRTGMDPGAMLDALERAAASAGKGAVILETTTLPHHLNNALTLDRLTTTMVGICGLLALAMAMIGVYGTMADAVERRTREIGLRMALGAGRLQVARLISLEALSIAAAGILVGLSATLALRQMGQVLLSGLPEMEAGVMVGAIAALALAMGLAAVVPLQRALRVSPNIALRAE